MIKRKRKSQTTELVLLRTRSVTHNDDSLHLRLDHLKTLRLEVNHIDADLYVDAISYMIHPENRKYLEIDLVERDSLDASVFQALQKMKTLRVFGRIAHADDITSHLSELFHISELVWGYIPHFNYQQLLQIINNILIIWNN